MQVAPQPVLPWQPSVLFLVHRPPLFSGPALPVLSSISFHFPKLCSSKESLLSETGQQHNPASTKPLRPPTMPEVDHMPSMKPPPLSFNATLTTTTLLPWEEVHMQVHTILIVVIFCGVCFLLLLALFYAFCFHCSIGSLPKDLHTANGGSLDREDATYRRSSSDNQPVGNIV